MIRASHEPSEERVATESAEVGDGWFLPILLIAGLTVTAVHAVRPMATYRALALGAGPFEIGMLPVGFAAVALMAALPIGRWIDRVGESRFILAGNLVLAASSLAMIWVSSIPMLVMTQAGLGFGMVMSVVAIQTMIGNRTTSGRRDHRYGVFAFCVSSGQMAGPLMAGFVATQTAEGRDLVVGSTAPVFLMGAAAAGAASLIAVTIVWRPGPTMLLGPASHVGYVAAALSVLRRPSIVPAILVSTAIVLSTDLMLTYLPAYGVEHGLSVGLVGTLLSLRAASSMASRLAMAALIRGVGRAAVLFGSLALASVSIATIPFASGTPVLIGVTALMGLGQGIGQPLTISWVAGQVPQRARGTALAIRITGSRLGQVLVPGIVGLIAGAVGLAAVFGVAASLLAAAATLVLRTPFGDPSAARRNGNGSESGETFEG